MRKSLRANEVVVAVSAATIESLTITAPSGATVPVLDGGVPDGEP